MIIQFRTRPRPLSRVVLGESFLGSSAYASGGPSPEASRSYLATIALKPMEMGRCCTLSTALSSSTFPLNGSSTAGGLRAQPRAFTPSDPVGRGDAPSRLPTRAHFPCEAQGVPRVSAEKHEGLRDIERRLSTVVGVKGVERVPNLLQ